MSPNCVHSPLENPSCQHSGTNHLTHTPAPFHIYTFSRLFFLCVNLFFGVQVRLEQTCPAQQSPRRLRQKFLLCNSFITWVLQTKQNAKFFNQQCCYSSRALGFMHHLYILHISKNTLSFIETSTTDILQFFSISGTDCTPQQMWKTTSMYKVRRCYLVSTHQIPTQSLGSPEHNLRQSWATVRAALHTSSCFFMLYLNL